MLKITCSLLALVIILSVLYSNKVECRVLHQSLKGIPASELHHLHFGENQMKKGSHDEDSHDEYDHVKRKSDFLLSLYGLPYTLVNKREAN